MNDFRRALSLLTTLPVRPADDEAPWGRAMAWYPAVGLVIGGLLVLAQALLHFLPPVGSAGALVRGALLVALWAGLTGGLHLDGWADCCDALLAPVARDRRLEILKDPRVGSFGAAGLILLLLLKCGGAAAVSPRGLLLAPVLARWVLVLVAAGWPSARPGGMGDHFRAGLGPQQVRWATVTALLAAAFGGVLGLLLLGIAWVVARRLAEAANQRLGGLTGDVYGAVVEAVEMVVVLSAAVLEGCL